MAPCRAYRIITRAFPDELPRLKGLRDSSQACGGDPPIFGRANLDRPPPLQSQREIRASISACMRSLYSSDQCAPGFCLSALFCCERGCCELVCCEPGGRAMGGVLLSLGDFRGPAGSLSVTRDDLVFEGEFELFMRLSGTYGVGLVARLLYPMPWPSME